jgi:cytochrome c553
MKKSLGLTLTLGAMAALASGCADLNQSRDLGNPKVPPEVTARQVCADCHGVEGNPTSPEFPRLAGQQKDYIIAQLKKFRTEVRSDPAAQNYMWGMAHNLTDAQIKGLAEYFSQQVPTHSPITNPARYARGKEIFHKGIPAEEAPPCMACHGPNADGHGTFPRLASQQASYIVRQLEVFQKNQGRPGTPMTQVTHRMSHQDMLDVAAYLSALPATEASSR